MKLFELVLFNLVKAFEICCLFFNTKNCLDIVGKIKYEDFRIFTLYGAFCCMRMRVYRKMRTKITILSIIQVRAATEQLVILEK